MATKTTNETTKRIKRGRPAHPKWAQIRQELATNGVAFIRTVDAVNALATKTVRGERVTSRFGETWKALGDKADKAERAKILHTNVSLRLPGNRVERAKGGFNIIAKPEGLTKIVTQMTPDGTGLITVTDEAWAAAEAFVSQSSDETVTEVHDAPVNVELTEIDDLNEVDEPTVDDLAETEAWMAEELV